MSTLERLMRESVLRFKPEDNATFTIEVREVNDLLTDLSTLRSAAESADRRVQNAWSYALATIAIVISIVAMLNSVFLR